MSWARGVGGARPVRGARQLRGGAVLALVAATSGVAYALGDPAPLLARDAELASLLRAMAGMKALIVAPLTAAVLWRLRHPLGAPRLAGYALSLGAMAAAAALVWQLDHLRLASPLFHAGLVAFALLAWRDDGTPWRAGAAR